MSVSPIGSTVGQEQCVARMNAQQNALLMQSMLKSAQLEQHLSSGADALTQVDNTAFDAFLDAPLDGNEPMGVNLPKRVQEQQAAPVVPLLKEDNPVDVFIRSLWPKVRQAAQAIGLDPRVLLAQAALETGWGASVIKDGAGVSTHNLFNIKAPSHNAKESVVSKTTEYVAQEPIKTTAAFKSYASAADSVDDYVALITKNARYQAAVTHANVPEHYVHALQKAGYATDPDYAAKILSIYHGDILQQAMQRCGI